MTRKTSKWSVLALTVIVLMAVLSGCNRLSRSIHQEPPAEDIVCLTEQVQYPVGTERISIQVDNRGDYRGEINKPYLEVKRSDKWYILPKNTQEPETANLLYVHPGEPQEWDIYLGAYDLSPGEYRAVFDYWDSDGYFAFPFEMIEAS